MTQETLVDVEQLTPNSDSLFDELKSEGEAPQEAEQLEQYNVPSKFKGKPVSDILKSYEELEKQFGKQGQELGDIRRLADEMMKRQLNSENPNSDNSNSRWNTEQENDILSQEPSKIVDRIVEQKLAPALKEIQEYKKDKMTVKLQDSHPDFLDIVKDLEFQEWVKTSRIRLELFNLADQSYDYSAADELFAVWKERKGIKPKSKEDTKAQNESFNNATMETGTAEERSPGKKYRRVDLMDLKLRNPERYEALQPEILRAYAEGRVV